MVVALIDDDAEVLESLAEVLRHYEIPTRPFRSATTFLKARGELDLDCIVSDVRMDEMTGIELLKVLNQENCRAPLILITGHGDVTMAVSCLKQGAFDFLDKPLDIDLTVESIRLAMARSAITRNDEATRVKFQTALKELTNRQREVMDLVVEGMSNKEIAIGLGISPRTVENYRAWVMEKTGARNLAELVRLVMKFDGGGTRG